MLTFSKQKRMEELTALVEDYATGIMSWITLRWRIMVRPALP